MTSRKKSGFLVMTGMNLGAEGKRFEPGDIIPSGEFLKLVLSKPDREALIAQGTVVPQEDETDEGAL